MVVLKLSNMSCTAMKHLAEGLLSCMGHTEVSCLLCIRVNINSTHNGMQFTWP
jgi:hypothetical protein